jgi:hypothetical protein
VPRAATLAALADALRARGLALRGAFQCGPQDALPGPGGRPAATVALAGQAGPGLWERFARERRDESDPLDAWSARALSALAERFGARLVLPGDGPPFAPFQRWARRAEPVHPSPLGILIHPEFGLWHAYRGALLFAERLEGARPEETPPPDAREGPCAACPGRPCLSACPVGAFAEPAAGAPARYDAVACAAHVASPAGAACAGEGCLARRACPVGAAHAYAPAQQRFHMAAFLAAHREP